MSEKTLLSFFWDLASTNESIRIDAAVNLIQYLKSAQNTREVQNDSTAELKPDDLTYTLKRLVKGLASSRKSARQGFAMALTEVILMFDAVTVENIINFMSDCLTITKSSSTQEERDAYIGQLFGLVTLGRAICLGKNNRNGNIQKSSITLVVRRLKELLAKKSYLQEACYKAIVDILAMLNFSEFKEYLLPVLENDIKCSWEKCSPDSLVLVLASWRLYKEDIGRKLFKKSWSSSHLGSSENYPLFAKILQNSHISHPRVHSVWDEVFHLILNSPKSDFGKFWTTVVDENLFQSSHERKFLGFKLLEKVTPMLSLDQVEIVFSSQLMHCLFNSLAHNTNYLYAAAKKMIEEFGDVMILKNKQELIPQIIKQLLGRNGNICFDAVTKTKTVENLLSKLRAEDLPQFVKWLKETFNVGTTNLEDCGDFGVPGQVDKIREGILGVFLLLIRCKQLEQKSLWVLDAVFFVFENAYFETNLSPQMSSRSRILCKKRFNSILGDLASLAGRSKTNADSGSKDSFPTHQEKKFGYAEDGRLWISHIMHHAKDILKSEETKIAGEIWTEEVHAIFRKTMKIVRKLEEPSEISPENNAFALMFLYVGVQLFGEPRQAREILEELFHCFEKVKAQLSNKVQEDGPHWMDVVTEILLSLLTETSNLRRHVVGQVFHIIVPHLTSSALKIILEAINPRYGFNEDSSLQIEDYEEEDEIMSDEDDDEEAVSDQSSKNDSSGKNGSDDDEDGEEADDDSKESIDPLFKVDLQAALGNALANEQDDENEAEQSDSDFDDETMMKVDNALSEVFRQHLKGKAGKKKLKDAKMSLLHFKLRNYQCENAIVAKLSRLRFGQRSLSLLKELGVKLIVLDLVEIVIKKQPCSSLILELMQPLLEIIGTCFNNKDFKTLAERAQGIFKNKLCSIKEHPYLSTSYIESIHLNIEFLLQAAIKARSVTMVTLISTGCLFLIRQLRSSKGTGEKESGIKKTGEKDNEFIHLDFPRLKAAYSEALKDFMLHRNTHLHPLLFQDLINRCPVVGWTLAEDLVTYITKGINNFRKIQACTMLSQLLNRKVKTQDENLKAIAKPLLDAFHSVFDQLSSAETEMKAKHLRQILKWASQFIRILKAEPKLWSMVNPERLEESMSAVFESKTAERANDLRTIIIRLRAEITSTSTADSKSTDKKTKKKKKTKAY